MSRAVPFDSPRIINLDAVRRRAGLRGTRRVEGTDVYDALAKHLATTAADNSGQGGSRPSPHRGDSVYPFKATMPRAKGAGPRRVDAGTSTIAIRPFHTRRLEADLDRLVEELETGLDELTARLEALLRGDDSI